MYIFFFIQTLLYIIKLFQFNEIIFFNKLEKNQPKFLFTYYQPLKIIFVQNFSEFSTLKTQ